MPNVNILISQVSDPISGTTKRTAKYAPGPGTPDWATVGDKGEIDVAHAPASTPSNPNAPAVNLVFTLPEGYRFHASTPFSPASGDFEVVSGENTTTLTVSDTNNDSTVGTEHEYTLMLWDNTTLDPMVINR